VNEKAGFQCSGLCSRSQGQTPALRDQAGTDRSLVRTGARGAAFFLYAAGTNGCSSALRRQEKNDRLWLENFEITGTVKFPQARSCDHLWRYLGTTQAKSREYPV